MPLLRCRTATGAAIASTGLLGRTGEERADDRELWRPRGGEGEGVGGGAMPFDAALGEAVGKAMTGNGAGTACIPRKDISAASASAFFFARSAPTEANLSTIPFSSSAGLSSL